MKSDLKYVSSTEEGGDVCSYLNGVIKAQAASLQTNLRSERYCSPELRLSSLLCLCIYTASLCRLACFYIDCGFSEGPGKEGSGLGGHTASTSRGPRARMTSVSILQVGKAVESWLQGQDDFPKV